MSAADPLAALTEAVAELKKTAEEFSAEGMSAAECVQAEKLAFDALRFGIEVRGLARIGLRRTKARPPRKVRSMTGHQREQFRGAVDAVLLRVGMPSREAAEEHVEKAARALLRNAQLDDDAAMALLDPERSDA